MIELDPFRHWDNPNERIKSLLVETNNFDSVLFIFDSSCRYRFNKSELGITHPRDLLLRNRGIISLLNPSWRYFLYYLEERKAQSLSGWLGKIQQLNKRLPKTGECYIFISRDKHNATLIYPIEGEYVSIDLHRPSALYRIKRGQPIARSYPEVCQILQQLKTTDKKGKKP